MIKLNSFANNYDNIIKEWQEKKLKSKANFIVKL